MEKDIAAKAEIERLQQEVIKQKITERETEREKEKTGTIKEATIQAVMAQELERKERDDILVKVLRGLEQGSGGANEVCYFICFSMGDWR